jgi:hypothetical protein
MREDTAVQYLGYKLIESNKDWKAKWFYISNHHPELPKSSRNRPKHRPWWNTEPTMQEGIQLPELLKKICDSPGFQPGLLTLMSRVNRVHFGQMVVNLGHHLENITDNP